MHESIDHFVPCKSALISVPCKSALISWLVHWLLIQVLTDAQLTFGKSSEIQCVSRHRHLTSSQLGFSTYKLIRQMMNMSSRSRSSQA